MLKLIRKIVGSLCLMICNQVLADGYESALKLADEGNEVAAIVALREFLVAEPDHAGAWLDLAIYACRVGDEVLRREALHRLDMLNPLPLIIREVVDLHKAYSCSLAAGGGGKVNVAFYSGYARNLNQASTRPVVELPNSLVLLLDKSLLARSAPFVALEAGWQKTLQRPGQSLGLGVYFQNYIDERKFDFGLVQLRWIARDTKEAGDFEYRLSYTHHFLGGGSYLGISGVQVLWQAPSAFLGSTRHGFMFSGTRLDYAQLSSYGTQIWEPALTVDWPFSTKNKLRLMIGWMYDQALAHRPGGDRRGPWGQLELSRRIEGRQYWQITYRQQRFSEEEAYAQFLFGSLRREVRMHTVLASWVWQQTDRSQLVIEGRWQKQVDTVPLFPFSSASISVGWRTEF